MKNPTGLDIVEDAGPDYDFRYIRGRRGIREDMCPSCFSTDTEVIELGRHCYGCGDDWQGVEVTKM